MSSGASLQLFPSSNPYKNGPKRKGSRRYPVKAQSAEPTIEELKAIDGGAKAVVIEVFEDSRTPSPISSPPKAHIAERSRSNTATSPLCERRGATSPAPLRAASPAETLYRSTHSTSPTLVRSDSIASTTDTCSPLMQSIFPRYNPNVPLAQQQYYPGRASPTNLPREVISKAEYSPSLCSPGSAGGRGGNMEMSRMTPMEHVDYSTVEDLARLWEAANGQSSQETSNSIRMQICRATSIEASEESWVFGPSATKPFYDLQTHTASELTIRRHHPQSPSTIVPIAVLDLEEPSTPQHPPSDGLSTLIFPKLAALMAMDQAATTASTYGLPQTDHDSLTTDAVALAADKEACKLRWDADSATYQLIHPTLADGLSQLFPIVVEGTAGLNATDNAKGRISLLSPKDPTNALVSLDFSTNTLTIDARALITSYPSLYIVDVTVTAILAVALVEGRRSSINTHTPTFSAPPTIAEGEDGRSKIKSKTGTKTGTDLLENYMGGRELPKTTAGLLKLLFWALRIVVWALTLGFRGLARVVLAVSAVAQRA